MNLEQVLFENGYEGMIYFTSPDYDEAFIGVSEDNRAVYDYDLMIESLMKVQNWSYEEAVEWIEYNTIRALPYAGNDGPIVIHRLENLID